jgi:hypothetical protein
MASVSPRLNCSTLTYYCPWWQECVSCSPDKISITNDWIWVAGSTATVETEEVYINGTITTVDVNTTLDVWGNEVSTPFGISVIVNGQEVYSVDVSAAGQQSTTLRFEVYRNVNGNVKIRYRISERASYGKPTRSFSSPVINYETAYIPQYTNELRVYFLKLPWATQEALESIMPRIADSVNTIIVPLGYQYVGYRINWDESYFSLYYLKTGTPTIPLQTILVYIIASLFAVGLIIIGLAWLEQGRVQETYVREQADINEDILRLYEEGKLTYEQAQQLMQLSQIKIPSPLCSLLGIATIPVPQEWCGLANIIALACVGIGGLYLLGIVRDIFRR